MERVAGIRAVGMSNGVTVGELGRVSGGSGSGNDAGDGVLLGGQGMQAGAGMAGCGDSSPLYSRGQERFNAISHAIGVALGVFALGWMLRTIVPDPTPNTIAAVIIYSLSLIVLYAMSATYHVLPQGKAKRIFRVMDHCTIYLLIAGCYTPVCLTLLWGSPLGLTVLLIEWVIAVLGIVLNALNMHALPVKMFSMVSYLVMGWMVVFVPVPLLLEAGVGWLVWLLAGGVLYTVGIVFYILGKWHPRMHCVWHLFVLFGSASQLVGFAQLF